MIELSLQFEYLIINDKNAMLINFYIVNDKQKYEI